MGRINAFRKAAGVAAVALDAGLCRGSQAHARYLGLHWGRVEGLPLYGERAGLEGWSKEGDDASRVAGIRVNAPDDSPQVGVDWMLCSVQNRNLVLNPTMKAVGIGLARQGRGWAWVVSLPPVRRRGDGPPVAYPGDGQKDVPPLAGADVPGQPRGTKAGFPVSLSFFPLAKVSGVEAALEDADGHEVPAWISTPAKRLRGTGTYVQVVLVPRSPLLAGKSYSARVRATVDGKAFERAWSFATADDPDTEQGVASRLLADLNAVRRLVGLGAVELDARLSRGCRLHASYLEKHLGHPSAQGMGVHDEDPSLPGFSTAGKKAGGASVIAVLPAPRDAVAQWMATLYHRVPLLDPALRRIGYAQARYAAGEWITVMDLSGK